MHLEIKQRAGGRISNSMIMRAVRKMWSCREDSCFQEGLHVPLCSAAQALCKEPGERRSGQTGASEGFSGQLSLAGANPHAQLLVLIRISHWVQTASSSLLADLFGWEHSILISPISAQSPWEVREPGTQVSSIQ